MTVSHIYCCQTYYSASGLLVKEGDHFAAGHKFDWLKEAVTTLQFLFFLMAKIN